MWQMAAQQLLRLLDFVFFFTPPEVLGTLYFLYKRLRKSRIFVKECHGTMSDIENFYRTRQMVWYGVFGGGLTVEAAQQIL